MYDAENDIIDGVGFADPGGRSALRAATRGNPRNLPCPNCRKPNRLTRIDKLRGYQCDDCADRAEGRGYGGEY
jgi:ribosomal protein L37AE/L43A